MNQPNGKRLPLEDMVQQKKYLTIEIPDDTSPATLLVVGEIVQYATTRLRTLGVDPVRTKFYSARDISAI